jgi:hypothetical protein
MNKDRKDRVLYGNWEVQAPDGEILFHDGKKRVNWYLSRGLATIVGDKTIRLNFEPAGRRDQNDHYSLTPKPNNCVVCNTIDLSVLTKHHIIPSEYRKFYPLEIKSRSSHDICPICREHHNQYEIEANELKQKIAEEYGYDLNRHLVKNDFHQAIKLSKILLNDMSHIPEDRINQIRTEFTKYSGITLLTDETILEFCKRNKDVKVRTHGDMVIEEVIKQDKLFEFTVMWRQHFLDIMNPQYMPQYWNINRLLYFE